VILAGAGWWITGLRADLAVHKNNERQLTEAVQEQKDAIKQLQQDQQRIAQSHSAIDAVSRIQNQELRDLRERFNTKGNGEGRDVGAVAAARPQSVERIINRGTANAARCLEIVSGAPLTESEKNATKPSEINKECPSVANPAYKPVAGH
jgi:ABC-type transporter Mla subunit MlaD